MYVCMYVYVDVIYRHTMMHYEERRGVVGKLMKYFQKRERERERERYRIGMWDVGVRAKANL